MNKILNLNQKFSIRAPIAVCITVLPIISLFILSYAGNYSSMFLGFLLSRAQKQFLWILIGVILFYFIQILNLKFLNRRVFWLYSFLIIFLSLPFMAESIKGAQNWIFGIQPSEIGKLIIVIVVSKFLSDNKNQINSPYLIIAASIIVFVPIIILVFQKDFGTALVYFSILMPMLYWAGVKFIFIHLIASPIIVVYINMCFNVYSKYPSVEGNFPIIILVLWILFNVFVLVKLIIDSYFSQSFKMFTIIGIIILNIVSVYISDFSWSYLNKSNSPVSHIKGRIENFIVPELHPKEGGWSINQSMKAVGAGGFFGAGLGEGTQVKYGYLAEGDTDFIISSIAEAFGFIFILVIILIYLFLLYWLLIYAQHSRSSFFSFLIIGYSSIIFTHIAITLGMAVALAPITGLPAPFLSYGGSFTLSCFIMLGICNNISNNNNI